MVEQSKLVLVPNTSSKSKVWNNFSLASINKIINYRYAICNACFRSFVVRNESGRSTGTGSLQDHLNSANECKYTKRSLHQTSIKQFSTHKKHISSAEKEMLKELEAKFVICGYNSFKSLESESLLNLMQFFLKIGLTHGYVDIKDIFFGRNTISTYISELYISSKECIKSVILNLGKNPSLCFSCDIWTEQINHISYLDLTLYFVDNEFNLKHHLIAFQPFKDAHTSNNIFEMVNKISLDYGLNILTTPYVTDCGANIKAAFKRGEWYACFNHRLHTTIEKSWSKTLEESPEIKELYDQMKKVQHYFHLSSNKENMLPYKIPSGCITRPWTGLSRFFSAFTKSYDKILEIIFEFSDIMPPTNKRLLLALNDAFQSIRPIITMLEASNQPTLHLVLLSYLKLRKIVSCWPPIIYAFKSKIDQCLFDTYGKSITNMHMIACYLHPKFKSLNFLYAEENNLSLRNDNLLNNLRMLELDLGFSTNSNVVTYYEEPTAIYEVGLFDDFADVKHSVVINEPVTLENEVKAYNEMVINTDFDNPLTFWKNTDFNILRKIAKKVFVIPASSAEPERHNSAGGNTISHLRNSLSEDKLGEIVFLNEYYKNKI